MQALWLVCGIGAAVFAAGPAGVARMAAVVAGFGLAAWAGTADAATVAGFAAVVAGCGVFRPAWTTLPAFAAGVLAGTLGGLLASQGVPSPVALIAAALVPGATMALAGQGGFAPERVREEGMLLMLALGLGAAVGPAVLDGWRSAGSMNIAGNAAGEAAQAMPGWVVSVTGASVLLGGAWSLWRHQ